MKRSTLRPVWSLILCALCSGCNPALWTPQNPTWQGAYNLGKGGLAGYYIAEPVLLGETGNLLLLDEYATWLNDDLGRIKTITAEHRIAARPNLSYEIHTLSGRQKTYRQLLILREQDGSKKRALEMSAPIDDAPLDSAGIARARDEWMRLCNAHQPARLVETVYHPQAIYYNHKPVVIGTRAISEEYQYMAAPNYQLSLRPLALEPVNEWLAYEIGQCSGSYGEKYVIVWQKTADGEWKVLMDSNY